MFVLCCGWDYEGEAVLGVYASLEDAQAAANSYVGYQDMICVYEVEVGAPAEVDREPVWVRVD